MLPIGVGFQVFTQQHFSRRSQEIKPPAISRTHAARTEPNNEAATASVRGNDEEFSQRWRWEHALRRREAFFAYFLWPFGQKVRRLAGRVPPL
jgi:hypothetical protein